MVNVNKLKGKMVECGVNAEKLAAQIGVNTSTFYRKLGKGESFTIKEADIIAKELHLTAAEVNAIFFSQFVA